MAITDNNRELLESAISTTSPSPSDIAECLTPEMHASVAKYFRELPLSETMPMMPPTPQSTPYDTTKAGVNLWRAIAQAQAATRVIGRDSYNEDGQYSYAGSDVLCGEAKRVCKAPGLLWLTNFIPSDEQPAPEGSNEPWIYCNVTVYWMLIHDESGEMISGHATMPAIASPLYPPHKAIAATDTYIRGFLARSLFNIERDPGATKHDDAESMGMPLASQRPPRYGDFGIMPGPNMKRGTKPPKAPKDLEKKGEMQSPQETPKPDAQTPEKPKAPPKKTRKELKEEKQNAKDFTALRVECGQLTQMIQSHPDCSIPAAEFIQELTGNKQWKGLPKHNSYEEYEQAVSAMKTFLGED